MRITGNTLPEPASESATLVTNSQLCHPSARAMCQMSGRSPNRVAKEFTAQIHPDDARQVFWRTRTPHRCRSAPWPRRPMSLAPALCYALSPAHRACQPTAAAWLRLNSCNAAISVCCNGSSSSCFRVMDAQVDQPRAAIRQVVCRANCAPLVDQVLAQGTGESVTKAQRIRADSACPATTARMNSSAGMSKQGN